MVSLSEHLERGGERLSYRIDLLPVKKGWAVAFLTQMGRTLTKKGVSDGKECACYIKNVSLAPMMASIAQERPSMTGKERL